MVSRIQTVTFQGVDVLDIDVQVQMTNGLPAFQIVGLPDKAIAESRERVRGALHALGISLPAKRITVNLAPADVMKEGSHFDLPIALGILCAIGVIPQEELDAYLVLGELSLDASLRAVSGVLPAAVQAHQHGKGLICPEDTGSEASWADIDVLAPANLMSLLNHFKGTQILSTPETPIIDPQSNGSADMQEVKGQESAKRAMEIAAAGGHNLLMIGPPGSGKSMLASRLPTILPPLDPAEALAVSMVHSIAGNLKNGEILHHRPYRDPHHSASLPAMIGGGNRARPGEISLAHMGVLFLDELPEFTRQTLEALRQPIETGEALVSRANYHVRFPAQFQLIAAMNPCKCGYLGDPARACSRAPKCGTDYQAKISGPMLDRFDLHIDVPAVSVSDLSSAPAGETSEVIRQRVLQARAMQKQRFADIGQSDLRCNAEAHGQSLEQIMKLASDAKELLVKAAEKMGLSARGYHRIIKVARTIADLNQTEEIQRADMAEALMYRQK